MARIWWGGGEGKHRRRVVDGYVWSHENGFVQDVDDDDLVERLREDGSFVVLAEEESVAEPVVQDKTGEDTPVSIDSDIEEESDD